MRLLLARCGFQPRCFLIELDDRDGARLVLLAPGLLPMKKQTIHQLNYQIEFFEKIHDDTVLDETFLSGASKRFYLRWNELTARMDEKIVGSERSTRSGSTGRPPRPPKSRSDTPQEQPLGRKSSRRHNLFDNNDKRIFPVCILGFC